ncbi:MAG: hypothetical protein EBR67_09325, partial [Proteobacteria bacterium]|nr:hypothetical protein [Pseudomonadota bacterium]
MVLKINYQRIFKLKASVFVSVFFLLMFFLNSLCFAAETVQETTAQRAVSRLRRTNDRSVPSLISSDADAEHARQVSYASKRKYKLDLSSLHEDHEDDENAGNGVVQWSLKHKFLKLDALPSNKAPKAEDKFDVILEGVLRSDSGFQKERLRVFLDDSLISSPEDFIIQTLAKDNRVRFTFAKSGLSYKAKAANLIKIKFVDTDLAGNVLAEREIPVFFKPRDTFETSPAFGGFFDTQKIVALKVEIYDDAASQLTSIESSEISSKLNKPLKVSSDKKKFLLTFEHDPRYIQGESESTFSEKN